MRKEVKKSPCHPEALAEGSYEILHYVQNDRPVQSGRTLMETMATVAIMGILGVAGVAAYNSAMNRYRANTLINEAQRRAVVVSGQIGFNGREPSLTEFEPYNKTSAGEFGDVITEGLYKQFGIQVSGVTKPVCQNILNTLGEATPIRRLSKTDTPTIPITTCEETNSFLFIYNDDMSTKNDTHYCESDESCDACGTCNSTTHACEDECILPTNACGEDSDCNTENECMVCDTTTQACKNGCERVEYLESTGTQWIDTGIPLSSENTVKTKIRIILVNNSFFYGARKSYSVDAFGLHRNYAPFGSDAGMNYVVLYAGADYIVEQSQNGIFINGELKNTYPVSTFTTPENCYLFYLRQKIGFYDSPASARIYYFQVYNNTLVRDFIPVLSPESSKGEGKPCMFDRVTKKLFCNAGTGEFLTNKDY